MHNNIITGLVVRYLAEIMILKLTVVCLGLLAVALQVDSKESSKHLSSPFRLAKHNLLWERAKKNFQQSPKLDSLYRELKKLDKLSLSLKHLEDKESDEARQMATDTKEMYIDILNRYGLSTNKLGQEGNQHTKAKFSDKIEKLWQEAVYSGKFSSDELEGLEKEFKDHEKRIEEYRQMADTIVDHAAISENDIRSLDQLSDNEVKKLKKNMKLTHHNISSHFLHLQSKVKDRVSNVDGEFTDTRVLELWEHAQAGGFTKDELESIKQELRHFQIRIDKHNYWEERQHKMGQEMNEGYITEPLKHEEIVDKVREHRRLVKKYHATMLDRVHRKDEL